jgi:hypothetical protein
MAEIDVTVKLLVNKIDVTIREENTVRNFVVSSSAYVITGGEANTINSIVVGEPIGSDVVPNVVSLTQAEYDGGTKNPTTLYIIKN